MSFKENLNTKIKLDRILQKLVFTIIEPPERWWLNKDLARELLDMTDFEHEKYRDLHLYVRHLEDENMEVVVFDNELAIYHTSVADVALRKSPNWQEMVSISNIKKIMNDKDVIISKGKESLKRLYANAVSRLDLTFTGEDLALLLEDARNGLEENSLDRIRESLDLFFGLLDFEPAPVEVPEWSLQIFSRARVDGGDVPTFEHLILFDEKDLSLGLKKGPFERQSDSDLAWVLQYAQGEKKADLQGMDVFEFLAELARDKARTRK